MGTGLPLTSTASTAWSTADQPPLLETSSSSPSANIHLLCSRFSSVRLQFKLSSWVHGHQCLLCPQRVQSITRSVVPSAYLQHTQQISSLLVVSSQGCVVFFGGPSPSLPYGWYCSQAWSCSRFAALPIAFSLALAFAFALASAFGFVCFPSTSAPTCVGSKPRDRKASSSRGRAAYSLS